LHGGEDDGILLLPQRSGLLRRGERGRRHGVRHSKRRGSHGL
jgi:hypothetical protein